MEAKKFIDILYRAIEEGENAESIICTTDSWHYSWEKGDVIIVQKNQKENTHTYSISTGVIKQT